MISICHYNIFYEKRRERMKYIQGVICIVVCVVCCLSLTKVLSYDITMPIMFFGLGIVDLLTAVKSWNKGRKREGIFMLLIAFFIFFVAFYNVFS